MSPRPARRMLARVAAASLVLVAAACGDDASPSGSGASSPAGTGSVSSTSYAIVEDTPLVVSAIAGAVEAVEAARGGPQEYTEINVTPEVVNVFVAVEGDQEIAYVVPAGAEPEPAADPTARAGTPFTLDGVDLSAPVRLVQEVQDRFPGAVVVQVALVVVEEQGLVWALQHRSPLGGLFNTFYAPDGRLLGGAPTG